MAKQVIGVGTTANDGTGDPIRTALQKANANFTELYIPLNGVYADSYAVGDGTTDDTANLSTAASAASSAGKPLILGTKVYYVAGTLSLPDRLQIIGCATDLGEMIAGTGFSQRDYRSVTSQIKIGSTGKIIPGQSNTITGVIFLQKAVADLMPIANNAAAGTAAVAAFTGTCIDLTTKTTYDFHMASCMMLGFTNGIICSADGTKVYERIRLSRIYFDCLNPVFTAYVTDWGILDRLHSWEFVTAHISGAGNDLSTRNGVAYYIGARNDWAQLTDCVEYGWRTGFVVENSSAVQLTACSADNNSAAYTDQIGFDLRDSANNSSFIGMTGCRSAGQDTAVKVTVGTESSGCVVSISDMRSWGISNVHLDVQGGGVSVANWTMRGPTTTGLNMGASAGTVKLANVSFLSLTTDIVNSSSSKIHNINGTDETGAMLTNYLTVTADGAILHQ